MKVVGFYKKAFTAQDGRTISGINLYTGKPIERDGEGVCMVNRDFVSDSKLGRYGYVPKIGDDIQITYDRNGKVTDIQLL